MPNYNKVILAGYITRDISLTYLPSQTPVVEFGLAINRDWTDKDGNKHEEVCFIDCQAFGRIAENINKFFSKGRPIMIDGHLKFDQWEAQDGTKRSKHKIFVESFVFIDSKPQDQQVPPAAPEAAPPAEGDGNDSLPF